MAKKSDNTAEEVMEVNTVDETTEKEVVKTETTKKAYMYLGPDIKGGILLHGSVYDEIPKHLDETIKKAPTLKKLFVEVQNVPKFKSQLNLQSSVAFNLYRKLENELKEV